MRIGLMREVTANPRLQNPPWQIIYADKSGGETSATNRVLEESAKTILCVFIYDKTRYARIC
jgi:hypothetical protein